MDDETVRELDADDIVPRLLTACNGHPHANIAWPHYLLHDAVEEIKQLRSNVADFQELSDAHKEVLGKEREIAAEMERLRSALSEARRDALEEAAKVCDAANGRHFNLIPTERDEKAKQRRGAKVAAIMEVASAIRALKDAAGR